jgi:hypothetical protein
MTLYNSFFELKYYLSSSPETSASRPALEPAPALPTLGMPTFLIERSSSYAMNEEALAKR